MGFTTGVAIVTASDVAGLTGEAGLANLDSAADGATLAAIMNQVTTLIMVDLRRLRGGIDPTTVQNTADFMPAAAYKVCAIRFRSLAEADPRRVKSAEYEALYQGEIRTVAIQLPASSGSQVSSPRAFPRSVNFDSAPYMPPLDNRAPGRPGSVQIWQTK